MSILLVGCGGLFRSHVCDWNKPLLAEKDLCIALRFAQAEALDVPFVRLLVQITESKVLKRVLTDDNPP